MTDYFFGGGATYGLNAPPGTAEATGLSNRSLLTDDTPNTQSSTRMCGRTTSQPAMASATLPLGSWAALKFAGQRILRLNSHWFASVRLHRTTYSGANLITSSWR